MVYLAHISEDGTRQQSIREHLENTSLLAGQFAGFFGAAIKSIYQKFVNDKTKKSVVETCVKAVEQLYKDIHGEEKLNKAKESILEMLSEKGISISELEMDMLIESCVAEFNINFNKEDTTNE